MKNEVALRPSLDPAAFTRSVFPDRRSFQRLIDQHWELRILSGCRIFSATNRCPHCPSALLICVDFRDLWPGAAKAGLHLDIRLSLLDERWSRCRSEVLAWIDQEIYDGFLDVVRHPWPADYFGPYRAGIPAAKNDVY